MLPTPPTKCTQYRLISLKVKLFIEASIHNLTEIYYSSPSVRPDRSLLLPHALRRLVGKRLEPIQIFRFGRFQTFHRILVVVVAVVAEAGIEGRFKIGHPGDHLLQASIGKLEERIVQKYRNMIGYFQKLLKSCLDAFNMCYLGAFRQIARLLDEWISQLILHPVLGPLQVGRFLGVVKILRHAAEHFHQLLDVIGGGRGGCCLVKKKGGGVWKKNRSTRGWSLHELKLPVADR